MTNLTKQEFQSYRKTLEERLDEIEVALTGGGSFAGELEDIAGQLNLIISSLRDYYKKGEMIRIADLPENVASKNYVDNKTKGFLYPQTTSPFMIDEVVEARDGDVNLKTQIQRYSKKVNLITDINALTSGEIDNTRVEPPDHNDTTNRDATDCHPEGAITGLTTDLASKVAKTSVIEDINASVEEAIISNIKVQPPEHNSTGGRDEEGCHPIGAITDLQSTLSDMQQSIDNINDVITGAQDGYSSLQYELECMRQFIQAMDDHLQQLGINYQSQQPGCWKPIGE